MVRQVLRSMPYVLLGTHRALGLPSLHSGYDGTTRHLAMAEVEHSGAMSVSSSMRTCCHTDTIATLDF